MYSRTCSSTSPERIRRHCNTEQALFTLNGSIHRRLPRLILRVHVASFHMEPLHNVQVPAARSIMECRAAICIGGRDLQPFVIQPLDDFQLPVLRRELHQRRTFRLGDLRDARAFVDEPFDGEHLPPLRGVRDARAAVVVAVHEIEHFLLHEPLGVRVRE